MNNDDNKPNMMKSNSDFSFDLPFDMNDKKDVRVNLPNPNNQPQKPKKEKNEDIGYTIGFIVLIVVIVGMIGLFIWSTLSSAPEKGPEPIVINYVDNIMVDEIAAYQRYDKDKQILFRVTNANINFLTIDINVTFYDDKNNIVDKVSTKLNAIGPNKKSYVIINASHEYAKYDAKVTSAVETNYVFKDYTEQITTQHSKQDGYYSVEIKNNLNVKLESASALVYYYKGNNIVGFGVSYTTNINPGETGLIKVEIPTNYKTRNPIDFDKIKVTPFSVYGLAQVATETQ